MVSHGGVVVVVVRLRGLWWSSTDGWLGLAEGVGLAAESE